jgi:hypothetical protein
MFQGTYARNDAVVKQRGDILLDVMNPLVWMTRSHNATDL